MRASCSPTAQSRYTGVRLAAVVAVAFALLIPGAVAQSTGSWTAVQQLPYRPVHATVLPSGKVLMVSYYAESLNPFLWDPATNTTTPAVNAPYEIFCAGHTVMADGRVFIAGGHIADYTGFTHAQMFDAQKNTFTATPDMNAGRWYPTATVLPSGDILVVSGDMTSNVSPDPLPQVYQVGSNNWRNLSTAQLQMPLYPTMMVAADGRVFNAAPSRYTRWLNPAGTGAWTLGPVMTFGGSRDYGPAVLYESGKILALGGSDPPTATAETLDLNAASPAWAATSSMHYPRRQHNAVVLPDGKVFVSGGSSGAGFDNNAAPVYPTEMWDPATGKWTVMASIAAYRGYHSTAFLLPDGRVFSGGGNIGGPNFQIFSPPYLSAGARPTITAAPTAVGYGQATLISTPDAASIAKVSLIRLPSVTHTLDGNQRFMTLSFTQTSGGLTVTFPANANLAPPGHYMLFLVNSAGVPSVAAILQIAAGAAPTTGTVTGLVTNTSGTALGGVSISGGGATTTTLSDGTYTLAGVATGSVTITASLTGYQNATTTVTVTAAANVTAPTLQLTALSPGNISGTVVSSTGTAIAGVTVSGGGISATTASNGTYTLSGLPAGTVTVTASATGYASASISVTVTSGSTITAPVITLTSNTGSVTGTVTDSNGAAISGATVGFGGGTATTNSSGAYTLSGVAAGTIQLVASATGYSSQTQNVVVAGGATVTANFTLAAAPATGSISGTVTNISTNGVLAGATVSWSGGSATTNSSGVYTLNNVTSGLQTFTATATGYITRSLSATVVGGATSTLNLPLATGAKINVVVKTSSGAVVSGATVAVSGGVVATSVSGSTNSSGVYLTPWIPIGNYTVTVSMTGHATQSKAATGNTGLTTTVTFSSF